MMSLARQAIASTSKTVLKASQNNVAPACLACFRAALRSSPSRRALRFQSTETTPSTPFSADLFPPHATDLQRTSASSAEQDANTDEKSRDATASSAATSSPTLADLQAFRPRKIRIPRETDLTNTSDFAIYQRKFEAVLGLVEKAFNKKQLIALAREMQLPKTHNSIGKRFLIRRIAKEVWELPDPEERIAREKDLERTKTKELERSEEAIPLKEKELFFLLGKMDGRELLHRLTSKNSVKSSVRGAPPGTLYVTGSPDDVKMFVQDWEEVKADMRTVELDSGKPSGLRPDLYKPLSMATETFVAPSSTSSKVEVTFRAASYAPSERVQGMLRRLAMHDQLQASIPRSAILPTEDLSSYASLPYIPREVPPWQFSSLPIYGLKRLSSLEEVGGQEKQLRAAHTAEQDAEESFDAAFGGGEGVTVHARFGDHLFIRPDARQTALESASFAALLEQQVEALSTFLPNAPSGILDAFRANTVRPLDDTDTSPTDVRVSSTSIRRLLYLPRNLSTPFHFIKLERDTPGPKELAKEAEENGDNPWTAVAGRQALADVFIPSASTDVRLAATKADAISGDVLLPFVDISRGNAPDTVTHEGHEYYIYEDHNIRRTVFEKLSLPWVDLEANDLVMERRTDRLNQGAKSVAVEISPKDGMAGYDGLMKSLQAM